MANSLFVDTSFFKAVIDQNDDFHDEAMELLGKLKEEESELVTTNYILDETYTLIRSKCSLELALKFKGFLDEGLLLMKYVRVQVDDEAKAWDWFAKDWSNLSFTDCVSFAVMNRLSLQNVVTFDKHFSRAGFSVNLS